ncbi:MAG: hypothetical protein DRR19_22255 [Candidatus Parabeggiatoa sp. nov. 1]|nr:MAG: hypothetical protein DRR19_22255 [Gammaproteobacteria bacterium]
MTIWSNRVMFIFFLIGNIHPLSFPRNDKKLNHKFSGIIFCPPSNVFLLPTEMVGKMVGSIQTLVGTKYLKICASVLIILYFVFLLENISIILCYSVSRLGAVQKQ